VDTLGRYQILGELGRGATGVVYDARDLLTDADVALKLIEPALWTPTSSAVERLRFLTEAMPAWRLRHPNIVTVHDAGDGDGRVYVAMERVAARSLRRMLDESRSPGIARAVRIAAAVAAALAHAHERGVVHRCLTPSSILVLADDAPKVTGFGMAPLREAALVAGNHAGSLAYLSPEQIRCDEPIDGRSDIFSLGVVLFEMLTGRLPFEGSSAAEIMRSVLDVEPPLPSEANPQVPPALDSIVWAMLAKNPDDRVPDADIVGRALQRVADELDGELAAEAGDDEGPTEDAAVMDGAAPVAPKRRLQTYALAAAILAAAGTGLVWQWRHSFYSDEDRRLAAVGPEPSTAAVPVRIEAPLAASEPPRAQARPSAPQPKRAAKASARRAVAPAVASVPAPAPETPAATTAFAVPLAMAIPASLTTEGEVQTKSSQLPATATILIDASPWGEIYVDGKPHGMTPPVKSLDLPPGRHRIELRNPSQPPFITFTTVTAGDVRRIRHAFE